MDEWNLFEANYDLIALTRRIFHPLPGYGVLGPGPEYRIVDPYDKGLYDLEPQPEYRINNLDNKVYPQPAESWSQFFVQCENIQFGSAASSSEVQLG